MVNSDELLKALGRAVREGEEPLGPDAMAATAPAKAASHEHVVDAVMAQLAGDNTAARPKRSSHATGETWGWRRKMWIGVPAMAAAAGLTLLLGRGWLGEEPSSSPQLGPYVAELSGAVSTLRSEPSTTTGSLTLAPGTELTVLLRPDSPIVGEVSAAVGITTEASGSTRRLETRTTVAASGALRLVFNVPPDLSLHGNLCTVVGRPTLLESALESDLGQGPGWQRFCWPYVHVDR